MKIKREVRHLHITCIIFSSFFVSFRLIQRSKDRISRLNNKVNEPTEYEVGELEKKKEYEEKIKNAGLQCETIEDFNLNMDQADLFMDLRSLECREQFDLEDWI